MKPRISDRTQRFLVGCLSIVALLTLWQAAAGFDLVDVRFSSSPMRIIHSASDMFNSSDFLLHATSSLSKFLWGMSWACGVGVPLGAAMGHNRRLRLALDPIVMVFYSVPSTTFLPLIILWFGIGINAYALLVFIGAVFPIMVNSMVGIRQVDAVLVRAARSFGASELDLFRLVLVPSALPIIMGGIRLGLGRGLMAVIFGEMYFSVSGIGHLIMRYQAGLNTDSLMLLVVVTASFGVTMIALARRVEGWLGPWRQFREVE